MKKALLVVLSIICVLAISLGIYFYLNKGEPVYFKIIKDNQQLDSFAVKWLKEKDLNKGLHIYSLENTNSYELLFYYNKNLGKNYYITSTLKAKIFNGVLKLNIVEELAVNDGFVNDEITAYFIIKEKPTDIELYINGNKENFELEKGSNKISK